MLIKALIAVKIKWNNTIKPFKAKNDTKTVILVN